MTVSFSIAVDFAVWYLEHMQFHVAPFNQHPIIDPATDRLSETDWLRWFHLSLLVARVDDKAESIALRETLLASELPEGFTRQMKEATQESFKALPTTYTDDEQKVIGVLGRLGVTLDLLPLSAVETLVSATQLPLSEATHLYGLYEKARGICTLLQYVADAFDGTFVDYKPLHTKGHPIKIMDAPSYGVLPRFGVYC
ncbi:MAG: hypothetical protein RBJ76_13310 [Stenomitos frigidus ULC029]